MKNRADTHDAKTMDSATAKHQLFPELEVHLNFPKYQQNKKMQLTSRRII